MFTDHFTKTFQFRTLNITTAMKRKSLIELFEQKKVRENKHFP